MTETSPPRRARARILIAAAAVVAAVAIAAGAYALGRSGTPAAAPTPAAITSSAAPPPAADDRPACRGVVDLSISADPSTVRLAALQAMAAADPDISSAGQDLADAANQAEVEPGSAANIAVAEAQLAVAEACAAKYGDGPW